MMRAVLRLLVVATLLMVAGCGSRRQWEVTAQNKAAVPSSIFVTLGADGANSAKVEDLTKGEPISLIVGANTTVVQNVKVVRGKAEEELTPKVELPIGKRYAIVIEADGTVTTTI